MSRKERMTVEVHVRSFFVKDDGEVPNNPDLPVIVYNGVFADDPSGLEAPSTGITGAELGRRRIRLPSLSQQHARSPGCAVRKRDRPGGR